MSPERYKDTDRKEAKVIPDDTGLIAASAGGDFEAFGELYRTYLERIYRYVFYQVGDRMTAEDLTEEVFLKAWTGIAKYRPQNVSFSAWLYRIAHNHVIDYFRSRKQPVALNDNIPAATGQPEEVVDNTLRRQELMKAVSLLPAEPRQLIILKFIEGMANREIEEIMQKSQGAIRIMQMRALAKLRQQLGSNLAHEG